MWILIEPYSTDLIRAGDEFDSGDRWMRFLREDIGKQFRSVMCGPAPVRRLVTGWDAVKHVLTVEELDHHKVAAIQRIINES